MDEATTRRELIDPALLRAGWDVRDPAQVRLEIPVGAPEGGTAEAQGDSDTYRVNPEGICDYALRPPDGCIIAVVEAAANIIQHAYHGEPNHSISFFFNKLPCGIEIEFLDEGSSVPPELIKSRDVDKIEPGGLGVHIMKCCMDTFEYEKRPGGGSRLVLRKFFSALAAKTPEEERKE